MPRPSRVRPLNKLFLLITTLLLASGLVVAHILLRRGPTQPGGDTKLPPPTATRAVIPTPPPRPVPVELHEAYHEIRKLQGDGACAAAAQLYPAFLEKLSRSWGKEHPDLAPYFYDFALALKLAGAEAQGAVIAARAREAWPAYLPLQVFETTTRAKAASARGSFDARADESFRSILAVENHPRLRGMRVEPHTLFAMWADMLQRSGRLSDALDRAEAGLTFEPESLPCREIRARLLVKLKRAAEARPLLEGLLGEKPSPEIELYLGIACLEDGDASAAWARFSRLLEDPPQSTDGSWREESSILLRWHAAKALNERGRHREAAEAILELLDREPEEVKALHQLAASVQALGAVQAAAALHRRIRFLGPREHILRSARQAAAAGYPSSVKYYEARAALFADNTGAALRLLDEALKLSPRLDRLHLERAWVRGLLGRFDAAERELALALKETASPVIAAELAALSARSGRTVEAMGLLETPRAAPAAGAAGGAETGDEEAAQDAKTLLRARRARAFLELRDPARARLELEGAESDDKEVLLCRAELEILAGGFDDAEGILHESFLEAAEGPSWARVLQAVLRIRRPADGGGGAKASADEALDVSDWLDHPRFFLNDAYFPVELSGREGAALAKLRQAHERRLGILGAMRGYADLDVVNRWRELVAFYLGIGAARKAREAAWYLVHLLPNSAEERRRLAAALAAPEEVVPRLAALRAGLRCAPGDASLEAEVTAARAFLGLAPKR